MDAYSPSQRAHQINIPWLWSCCSGRPRSHVSINFHFHAGKPSVAREREYQKYLDVSIPDVDSISSRACGECIMSRIESIAGKTVSNADFTHTPELKDHRNKLDTIYLSTKTLFHNKGTRSALLSSGSYAGEPDLAAVKTRMSFDNVSIYRDIDASQSDTFFELFLTAVLALVICLVFFLVYVLWHLQCMPDCANLSLPNRVALR
jgi:hypothetical protein